MVRFAIKFILLKIRILLFFSLAFSFSAQGQKPFSSRVLNYNWIYSYSSWGNIVDRYVRRIDTSVFHLNGKKYYTLDQFKVADSGTKVFCLSSSTEVLVMDYALNETDTINFRNGSRTHRMKVITKQKVKVENDSLWHIVLKPLDYATGFANVEWIESLGCISHGYHPINWLYYLGIYDVGYSLHCITNNDTSILKQFRKNCALENSLINPNKKWHTWGSDNNGDLKFSVPYYFTNRDTTLFGKKYQTMNQTNRYVRYDTLAGKYFILSNYNNGQELLVYSDMVKIGDTMATYGTFSDTVTKIENKWIEDDYRKVITTARDIYISGIGSVNRVMWDNHLVTFPEYQAGNICFEENGVIKYHYPFYYQNKEKCEITSNIQNGTVHSFYIYPNPVHSILNFSTADTKDYEIRTSLGLKILSGRCEDRIELSALAKGVYFLSYETRNGIFHTKFVKE